MDTRSGFSGVWMTWILCLLLDLPLGLGSEMPRQYCNEGTFEKHCGTDQVIMILSAEYGRMNFGVCVQKDLGFVGCKTDVLDIVDSFCSGRRSCSFRITDIGLKMRERGSCMTELKQYLEASSTCVDVQSIDPVQCKRANHVTLSAERGYIASVTTDETGCGTSTTPWVIKLPEGQRINITLYDFSGARQDEKGHPGGSCQAYVIFRENGETSQTLCGGGKRILPVYISKSNRLEIRVIQRHKTDHPHFMLKYEAVGCPDPNLDGLYELKRDDMKPNEAQVTCKATGESRKLICQDTTWRGTIANCTVGASPVFGAVQLGGISISFEVSVVIITIIASIISIFILMIGVICLRKKRASAPPPAPAPQPYAQRAPPVPKPGKPRGHYSSTLRRDGNEYACILDMPLPPTPQPCTDYTDSGCYQDIPADYPAYETTVSNVTAYPNDDSRYFELDPDRCPTSGLPVTRMIGYPIQHQLSDARQNDWQPPPNSG